ncbi:MAG TPA: 2-C-methyl-D-erythritol 4-phosphate cytidylyltransferase [Chitinophaga sp.]|uniref:2-C-methyl-D-erythritol 4-phosphate cytidylyltransferase n=1 Tax=Chitinophaga sp. TaxID=1869181 RepID=UPI002CEDECD9|nr:2-C-methyl-D-erythritol 4-phosphate cytidylyltransferase [Chitinophaga sp.]HVI48960.1 2-C-methyl-D-erythritol 4-phosphate cytidylyltransferase [Chitinophaga sp.]
MDKRNKVAVIVAGGTGTRMQSSVPKQFLDLAGRPVLYHSIAAFIAAFPDISIVLVSADAYSDHISNVLQHFTGQNIIVVNGGETRFHSVKNGLQQVSGDAVVFVHDGVRPLASASLIRHCYDAALSYGSAIPVIDMKDSIREVEGEKNRAVDRERFKIIQTPQTFLSELILPAFELPYDPLFTDEATVVERLGHAVYLIPGEEANIKITRPLDLVIAEKLLTLRESH